MQPHWYMCWAPCVPASQGLAAQDFSDGTEGHCLCHATTHHNYYLLLGHYYLFEVLLQLYSCMYCEQLLVILHICPVFFFAYCHVAKACCSFQVKAPPPASFLYMPFYSSLHSRAAPAPAPSGWWRGAASLIKYP